MEHPAASAPFASSVALWDAIAIARTELNVDTRDRGRARDRRGPADSPKPTLLPGSNGRAAQNGKTNGSFKPVQGGGPQSADEKALEIIRESPGIHVGQLASTIEAKDVFGTVGRLERRHAIRHRTHSGSAAELWPA